MGPYKFDSCAPIVKSETMSISRLLDVSGLNRVEPVQFSQEIHWVRHCESTCVIGKSPDRPLRGGSSYTDTRGYLRSVQPALQDGVDLLEPYGVDATSKLRVSVILKVTDKPCVMSDEPSFYRGANFKQWYEAPSDWITGDLDTFYRWRKATLEERGEMVAPVLRAISVVDGELWSSADLALSMDDQMAAMKERLAPAFLGFEPRDGDITIDELVASLGRTLGDALLQAA